MRRWDDIPASDDRQIRRDMPINFAPRAATVLICDYTTGFVPPEMVKRRPVIVLSSTRHERGLCLVVPVSTTRPHQPRSYHVALPVNRYSFLRSPADLWVKCNLINAVSTARLNRVHVGHQWITPTIDRVDFESVQVAVFHALDLQHLRLVR